jgi:hypothetical protein
MKCKYTWHIALSTSSSTAEALDTTLEVNCCFLMQLLLELGQYKFTRAEERDRFERKTACEGKNSMRCCAFRSCLHGRWAIETSCGSYLISFSPTVPKALETINVLFRSKQTITNEMAEALNCRYNSSWHIMSWRITRTRSDWLILRQHPQLQLLLLSTSERNNDRE